jgi:hypothetical protein
MNTNNESDKIEMAQNGVKSLGKVRRQGIVNLGVWEMSWEDKRTAKVQTNVQWRWASFQ